MRASLAYCLAASAAQHVVGSAVAPVLGYGVDIVEWDVEISPGRHEFLNGTVEQVYDQILEIKPDWKPVDVPAAAAALALTEKRGEKVKRGSVKCGFWEPTYKVRIFEGIQYLRRVKGSATHGPGPRRCARVSCSYNSAIWWCNDNPHEYTLESFSRIADSAKQIVNECTTLNIQKVAGQNFEDGNWNTIVRFDNDQC